jgi:malate permease and related proteins
MTVFNVLAPVFLLIALGVVLQRTRFVSDGFLREANKVTYWLGLPALLFGNLATSLRQADSADVMLTTLLIATALVIATGYLVAWMLRLHSTRVGTFVQGAFRGNLAYVGLPIVYSLPDVPSASGLSIRAAAVIAIAPMLVLYNVIGVTVLITSQHNLSRAMLLPLLKQLATTPPLIATLAGFTWALTGLPLPPAIALSFEWLGQMALPLALLGIGGALAQSRIAHEWRVPATAALVKTVLSPVFGYFIGRHLGLSGVELAVVMIFLATPTAGISYTMATQLKGDEPLASSTILVSTVIAIASLSVVLAIT